MYESNKKLIPVLIFFIVIKIVVGGPKKYEGEEGFEPSNRYYESNLSTGYHNQNRSQQVLERKNYDKESKLGNLLNSYAGPGPSGSGVGYGNGNVAYAISPMKIDLAGVALGVIIGLGAVLFLPKIGSLLTGGHPGYRNLENEISVPDILARIDNSLEQHNIDSSSCMQRIICSYVNDARQNSANGETTSVDEFVLAISNNTLFSRMLDGTAIKQAIEMGKGGDQEKCTSLFPKCPITRDNVLKVITSFLPA